MGGGGKNGGGASRQQNEAAAAQAGIARAVFDQSGQLRGQTFGHLSRLIDQPYGVVSDQLRGAFEPQRLAIEQQLAGARGSLENQLAGARGSLENQLVGAREGLESQYATARRAIEESSGARGGLLSSRLADAQIARAQDVGGLTRQANLSIADMDRQAAFARADMDRQAAFARAAHEGDLTRTAMSQYDQAFAQGLGVAVGAPPTAIQGLGQAGSLFGQQAAMQAQRSNALGGAIGGTLGKAAGSFLGPFGAAVGGGAGNRAASKLGF